MKSGVFTNGSESYQVSQIVYVGPVEEIPEEYRKFERTHSFRIVTTIGHSRCSYKSAEAARHAHGALFAIMKSANSEVFSHGTELLDPARIVCYGDAVTLKNPQGEYTHAIIVTMETADARGCKVWLKYKSQDKAKRGRRLLQALVSGSKGLKTDSEPKAQQETVAAAVKDAPGADADMPF